ncbi:MAG: choice-of-anchor D domain-containing protein [Candidatus Cloacimonetes bacterium]|jgi:predicted glutamine amidotransferase|nr:choice-of-anchor D domain-containing protein [Candidatus Cloacimonadota bacterium]
MKTELKKRNKLLNNCGWINNARMKVSLLIFIILFSVISSLSACAMSALISVQGHTLADFAQNGLAMNYREYNDPWDYFGFLMANSTATINNDGYGVAAYRDGDPDLLPDSIWFKRVISSGDLGQTYYTGKYLDPDYQNSGWDNDILDLAMNAIKTDANSVAIALCHSRKATGVSLGNHPFWFQHNGKTYTFMHNGHCSSAESYMINRINHMNSGINWFVQNPSNYFNNPDPTQWVDSELLFRYIMCHIIASQDNVLDGLNNALREISTYIDDVSHGVFNFIMSDGSNLYAFRSTPLTGAGSPYKLGYRGFPDQFYAIRTKTPSAGDTELRLQEMVVFSRDQSPKHYPNFVHGYYVATHEFHKTYVEELSLPLTVTLHSTSTDTLNITDIYWKSQPNLTCFSHTFDQLNEPVLPGESRSIEVRFAPLTEGVFTDTLCVASNTNYHPLLQIPFSGRGYMLHASFGYEPIAEDVQLRVNFSDTSKEGIIAWNWDFGDGSTSQDRNPSHVFAAEGTYAIELSVSDGIHYDTVSQDVQVSAHAMLACADTLVYDFGIEYIGHTSEAVTLTLRNSGADTLYFNDIGWQIGDMCFQFSFNNPAALILPGETTNIDLWFQPNQVGVFSDSLIIETNAENLPLLIIGVTGRGGYIPPKEPGNVTITMDGESAIISWDAVIQNIDGQPIAPDGYGVFCSTSSSGEFTFLGFTEELLYTHTGAALNQSVMFYRVIAYKIYDSTGCSIPNFRDSGYLSESRSPAEKDNPR